MQTPQKSGSGEFPHPKWELAHWQMERTARSLRRTERLDVVAVSAAKVDRNGAAVLVLTAKATSSQR